MADEKPKKATKPKVINKHTGKEMTDEEQEIADANRREEAGKCMHKCGSHPDEWCADMLKSHRYHRCAQCLE